MKKSFWPVFFVGLLLFVPVSAAPSAESAAASAPMANGESEKKPITYFQLRREIMDFADRYMQMIGQAVDALQRENTNLDSRIGIHSMKLFPTSAAFSIATDSSPKMGLLDMVVLVHLQGDVWKETIPKRFGEKGSALLEAQKMLEADIDDIAMRSLGADQLNRLKSLVAAWRLAHPNQRYVSYIRFNDFQELRVEGPQPRNGFNLSIAGLLSAFQLVNIDDASRSVDQARMVAERALYISQRMPSLLRWQSTMLMYELANMPETKNVLSLNQTLRDFPKQFAAEMTKAGILLLLFAFGLALLYKVLVRRLK